MSILDETVVRIQPPDALAMETVGKVLTEEKGLGRLRDLLLRYAGVTGQREPEIPKKCTIICCGDHGVAAKGVSAYPKETTVQMTANYLISRGAAANALANFASADLLVVDMGIAADTGNIPGLVNCHVADGTADFTEGPAMTREQAVAAVESGIKIATACAENGYQCFLPGEMGIANTTASAAICAAVCGISPEAATGRGTNISDERMANKISVVRRALERNRPDPFDGIDVLAKVGGFELGGIAGIILGAAAHRSMVFLDGFNTGAAALIASLIAPGVKDYLVASHLSAERGHGAVLRALGLEPFMDLRLRLGEGCGSSVAAVLLDAGIRAYHALAEHSNVDFKQEKMPADSPKVTDKTFNFYLQTMPVLDRQAMESCQSRMDNLAKPLECLGYLEQIAVEVAGILADDRPETGLHFDLLCFCRSGVLSPEQKSLMQAFAEEAEAEVTLACLRPELPPTAAFDFGRVTAEDITFAAPLIGIALAENSPKAPCGTKALELREALLDERGAMRYAPDEFLARVPKHLKADVAAVTGAIIAAAHNSSLVILDDDATEIIARYAVALCPAVQPYILHVQPDLLRMGMRSTGGMAACMGKRLVDASLHVLNDMKTFDETGVPVATDGPGTRRQQRESKRR